MPAAGPLVGALLIAFPGPATAAVSKTIGRAVHLKGTNVWYAHGTAVRPKALSATVVPVPPQTVKVQWAVVCQKGNPSDPADHLYTRETGGETVVHAAAVVRLALPYSGAPTCVATVYGTLTRAGQLALRIGQG
jgi:hypothetical protein